MAFVRQPTTEWSTRMQKPQSRVKMLFWLALLSGLTWTLYVLFFRSRIAVMQEGSYSARLDADGEIEQYGLNAPPPFSDMIQISNLPTENLPETGKHRRPARLIVVGDVHGMLNELAALLDKVHFDTDKDHLILAGDMVAKGPDSPGVVDLAMSLGATAVRGNHEDRIILAHTDMISEHVMLDQPGPSEEREKEVDDLEEESFSHGDYKDRALAKLLGEERIQWLKQCPVILRVGKLGDMGKVVVVHAGLAPGVKLEQQDPSMVMNMRTISENGVPSAKRLGEAWINVCLLPTSLHLTIF
jgi:hypothetical protein